MSSDSDASVYPVALRQQLERLHDSVMALSRVLVERFDLQDAEKTERVLVECCRWQALYEEAERLQPPEELASVHQRYLAALRAISEAGQQVITGITGLNAWAIWIATGHVYVGLIEFLMANTELRRILLATKGLGDC